MTGRLSECVTPMSLCCGLLRAPPTSSPSLVPSLVHGTSKSDSSGHVACLREISIRPRCSKCLLALREIEWVVSPNPQSDYAHKKGKLQREREHSEGEWHKKMGMIPPR